eukprot:2003200-Pleurochrysis_carterae.AAC.3
MAVHNRFGGGVLRWVCNLLCESCPLCVQKFTCKASSAGHKPITTKGFGSLGQVRKCAEVTPGGDADNAAADGRAEGTPGGGDADDAAADRGGAEGTPGGDANDAAAGGGSVEGTPGSRAGDGEGGADEGESA